MEMNATQAAGWLKEKGVDIQPSTFTKWLRLGYVEGRKAGKSWYAESGDVQAALDAGAIPPSAGRPGRFTADQKQLMVDLRNRDKQSLSAIASRFGCDQSFVSLVSRGLR